MRMKSIDSDLIEAKFDIIERNLKFLKEFKNTTNASFTKNYRDLQASKYSLLEITEACIDIANHIIASKAYRRAEKYSEMFEILSEENIIEKKLAEHLADMAAFRNLLVHRYGDINNSHILEIIRKDLKDIEQFMQQISKYLKEQGIKD